LYKVELLGNYNVYVEDLNYEFNPHKKIRHFKDSEIEGSEDIKLFLDKYLKYHKISKHNQKDKEITKIDEKIIDQIVDPIVEVKDDNTKIIQANGVSTTNSEDDNKIDSTIVADEKIEENITAVEEESTETVDDKKTNKKSTQKNKK